MTKIPKILLTAAGQLNITNLLEERGKENLLRNLGECSIGKFDKYLDLSEFYIEGYNVVTVKLNSRAAKNTHVVFLHGGGYVSEANMMHRKLIEKMVKLYGLKVSFVDYPLAPENSAEHIVSLALKAYSEITDRNADDEFVLFGDSAGGGLALLLLQQLRDRQVEPFPKRTVLFSPWVDVSMSNPDITTIEDPLLHMPGMVEAGRLFAGDLDVKDPMVSPLYHDMENLGAVLAFIGTEESLYPDCLLMRDKMEAANGTWIELQIVEGMVHDWILAPLPETREALDHIAEFYLNWM